MAAANEPAVDEWVIAGGKAIRSADKSDIAGLDENRFLKEEQYNFILFCSAESLRCLYNR